MRKEHLNNPLFAIFFSMIPVLVLSSSFEKGLIAASILFVVANLTSLIGYFIKDNLKKEHKIYAYLLVVAAQMTIIGLILNLVLPIDITQSGLYLSLFLINVVVISQAELVSERKVSLFNNFKITCSSFLVILVISLLREVLGTGSINFELLFDSKFVLFNSKYALSLLVDISGGLILTGMFAAIVFAIFDRKEGIEK